MIRELTEETVRALLPERRADSHKGDHGRALIVAGSLRFRGAAALCTLGALHTGAGLVTLAAPEAVIQTMGALIPEAMFLPVETGRLPQLREESNLPLLMQEAGKADALALGPGLSGDPVTAVWCRRLLEHSANAAVTDAGALTALQNETDVFRESPSSCILTPHPGEAARLLKVPAAEIVKDAPLAARTLASLTKSVVVLKLHRSILAAPDGALWQNTAGCDGLARGGSGDFLTGMIASLCAQGLSPADAACCAVWMHGRASEIAAARLSRSAMTVRDLIGGLQTLYRSWEL